ncbi:type III secretion system export apparatus subunit SctS [Diaphorobacter nitroreducens]|uniref:type III secretion system export apparatus subunit SctS n=1 Tax=Diaphorobacter nitroreducens TaxID=164759 RepID=UPI0035AD8358
MDQANLVSILVKAMYLTLWLSLPTIIVASVVGTLFSLFQALTQIQEQTLSFAVKLIAVMATLALTAGWVGSELYNYTVMVMDAIPRLGR